MNERQKGIVGRYAENWSVGVAAVDQDVIVSLYAHGDFDDEGVPSAPPVREMLLTPAGREVWIPKAVTPERREEIHAELTTLDEQRDEIKADPPRDVAEERRLWARRLATIGDKRRRLKLELLPRPIRIQIAKLVDELVIHHAIEQDATDDRDDDALYCLAAEEWCDGLREQLTETVEDLAVEPDYQSFVFDRAVWQAEVETRRAEAQADR